ncbi:hypothetical protein LY78DRAFT_659686 [Colletotrichum sublineola]|nr:hypothetical protein LY78DRAFT_659686 [Colletotrichum sublineola]
MEPLGLAVGVVGLAGLFSTCLEAVQKFDAYKNFGRDSRSLATQLDVDKHRFEEWGRTVGFESGRLSDSHHPALDDAEKLAVVRKLLSSIQEFCSSAEDALCQQHTQPDNGFAKGGSISARQTQPRYSAPEASRWRKAAAIRGRAETMRFLLSQKASAHVQDFYNATPLIAASRHGHESVVELLLQAENVSLEHEDGLGLTALSWARKSGNAHTLQLLLENSGKEDVQINGEDALTRKEAISFHEDWDYCDVCTICIPDGKAHHRCEVCFGGGDFCICSECYAAGMKCLDGSHKWTPWGGD